jgi:hypothetical protein
MRLIFSRKGFDTSNGGGPSPIMLDGRMLTLPIPEGIGAEGVRYADLRDVDGTDYLTLLRRIGYTKTQQDAAAHLDPDLIPTVRKRENGWRGMLGQHSSAEGHLRMQGVGSGDLFLFWGLFADQMRGERLKNLRRQHAVFGYLEVDRVIDAGAGGALAFAPYHPHFQSAYRGIQNRVYVATENFSRAPSLPGWGVFRWTPTLRLTPLSSQGVTEWRLPACFHPATGLVLSHHRQPHMWCDPAPDGSVIVQRRGQGQEFVCEASQEVIDWVVDLIGTTPIWAPDFSVTSAS